MKSIVKIDGKTLYDNSSPSKKNGMLSYSYSKTFGESISTLSITALKDGGDTSDSDLVAGAEVKIWNSDTTISTGSRTDLIFEGYIEKVGADNKQRTISCSDKLILTKWHTFEYDWTDFDTPPNVSTIISDMLSGSAGVGPAYGWSPVYSLSGTPGTKQTFKSEKHTVYNRLTMLLESINYQMWYNPVSDRIIIEPKGTQALQEFVIGWAGKTTNILGMPRWDDDGTGIMNDLTVVGGNATRSKIYKVNTDGVNSEWNVPEAATITNLRIFDVRTAINLVPYPEGVLWETTKTGVKYYYIPSAGQELTIVYSYEIHSQESVATDATSQSNYQKRSAKVFKRNIYEGDDLTDFRDFLIGNYEDSIVGVSFLANGALITPQVGSKANVYDGISGKSITYASNDCIVRRISLSFPGTGYDVQVSSKPFDNPFVLSQISDDLLNMGTELDQMKQNSYLRLDGSTTMVGDLIFGGSNSTEGYQIKKLRIENKSSAPDISTVQKGSLYFNSSNNVGYIFDGVAWRVIATRDWVESWVNSQGFATKSWVESQGYLTSCSCGGGGDDEEEEPPIDVF